MKSQHQVLVLPFSLVESDLYVYVFKRSNGGWWQFVSGGGEGEESIAETAIRELEEKTGIQIESELVELQTLTSIPISALKDKSVCSEKNIYVILEYSFAVNIGQSPITLSNEHTSFRFEKVEDAYNLLRYDSNKTALYELEQLFITGRLWERYYDRMKPGDNWVFNNGVAQVFHNMLRRSIPELEMMRNLVTMYGERYIYPGGIILDLGCSCGDSLFPFIKKHGSENRYIGVDCSEFMLTQAKSFFSQEVEDGIVQFLLMDLEKTFPKVEMCLALSVLTMQFLSEDSRKNCLRQVFDNLVLGGALLLVEKIRGDTLEEDAILTEIYHQFKNMQGYSWQEIERKRMSLQNNMKPVTMKQNFEMLHEIGFKQVSCFWRCLNFVAWIAIKE